MLSGWLYHSTELSHSGSLAISFTMIFKLMTNSPTITAKQGILIQTESVSRILLCLQKSLEDLHNVLCLCLSLSPSFSTYLSPQKALVFSGIWKCCGTYTWRLLLDLLWLRFDLICTLHWTTVSTKLKCVNVNVQTVCLHTKQNMSFYVL